VPHQITWNATVQIAGGPKASHSSTLEVEAYDVIAVEVADGADGVEVQVQPGGAGQVRFLMVSADPYSEDLSYSANAAEADPAQRNTLDALHLLVGAGAVSLLGDAPESLFFYNGSGAASAVRITVGRNVTA
jgi:hypothetical protein